MQLCQPQQQIKHAWYLVGEEQGEGQREGDPGRIVGDPWRSSARIAVEAWVYGVVMVISLLLLLCM